MKKTSPKVITIVGAESSGKTTLAKQLADALSCAWIPEYAREYLENLDRDYEIDDLTQIGRGQWTKIADFERRKKATIQVESGDLVKALKAFGGDMVIVDGGILTLRMWALIKYGKEIPAIEEWLRQDPTTLYLLCRPGKNWEPDPLREAPLHIDRAWIYNQYLKEILLKEYSFLIVQSLDI